MSTRRRPDFKLEGPFVALRELVAGEQTYQRGDAVDLAALGCSPHEIERLWDCYYVDCAPAPPVSAKGPGKRSPRAERPA